MYVKEAILLGVAFEQLAYVVAGSANLVAYFKEKALTVVHLKDLADVGVQHEDVEVILDADAEWMSTYMLKFLEDGSS